MIKIEHSFDFLGGLVEIVMRDHNAYVTYSPCCRPGDDAQIEIEDSFGEVMDWHRFYQKDCAGLSGAALRSKENCLAKEYALQSIKQWMIAMDEG